MSRVILSEGAKRWTGILVLPAIALFLGAADVFYLSVSSSGSEVVLDFSILGLSFVVLVGGSFWMKGRDFSGSEVWRVVTWSVAGLIGVSLVLGSTFYFELPSLGVSLERPYHLLFEEACLGAAAGTVFGLLDASRERERRGHREAARRFQSIAKNTPLGIVGFTQDGEVNIWNGSAEKIFGWRHGEVREDPLKLIPEGRMEEFEEWYGKAERGEVVKGFETQRCRSDGALVDVRIWSIPVMEEEGGEVLETIGLIQDITEEKERERELEERNRELTRQRRFTESVLDSIDEVFYLVAPDGSMERWNGRLAEVTGYGDEELRGMDAQEFVAEGERRELEEGLERALEGGKVRFRAVVDTRDGSRRDYEFSATPVKSPEGDTLVGGIARDVTAQVRNEQRLKVLHRVLRHNLRNGANLIEGLASDLVDRCEEGREELAAIVERSERLVELGGKAGRVEKILDPEDRERHPVNVAELVREEVERAKEEYPEVETIFESPESAWALCDEALRVPVREALDNAVVHGGEPVKVDIGVSEEKGGPVIEVLDNGPGIPEEEIVSLEEGTETSLVHGSGIGLWMIKWTVESLGGKARFENRVGEEGGAVVMELPGVEGENGGQ